MRPAIFLFFSLLAAIATGGILRFEPPNPTSRTPITVHLAGNFSTCTPTVTRNPYAPMISIDVGDCLHGSPPPVDVPVDLGVLPAGIYDVGVGAFLVGIAEETLVVQDAVPSFQVTPNAGVAGDEITIAGKLVGTGATFGGAGATTVSSTAGTLVVRVPPHAPGPVDVDSAALHAPGAFYYVPNDKAPNPAFYEPVLIPVAFSGPGAFGSQWRTDVTLRNENDFSLLIAGETPFRRPGAHSTMTPDANRPNGILAYIPRQGSSNAHLGVLVRDRSRQAQALGTEIPVVREKDFFDRPLELLNVPADPRFRAALRIYDRGTPAAIHFVIQPLAGDEKLVDDSVFPTGHDPAYAQISDLVAKYPRLAGRGPLRITIDPPVPGNPTLWGFVSVTNNDTQHVTTISPQ